MNNKEHPDTVFYGVYKQVAWERSLAEEQLNTLGFGLGCNVVCKRKPITNKTYKTLTVCSECGEQLHSDMNFCPYCGRKILND